MQPMTRLIALCFCTFLVTPAFGADFFLHHWENHHAPEGLIYLQPELGYFSTKSNFDPNNALQNVPGLESYSRIETDLSLQYGITRVLSFFGRLSWAKVDVNSAILAGSSFGFTDQQLGLGFRALEKKVWLDIQTQLEFPLYSNATAQSNGTPFMGDSTYDWSLGAFLTYPIPISGGSLITVAGGLGFTYRTQGFSQALPWSLVARWTPRNNGFFASFSFLGVRSLSTDRNFGGVSLGSGGSFVTYAINPSLATLRGQIGYQIDRKITLLASLSQGVFGQSAPGGLFVSMGAEIRLGYLDNIPTGVKRKDPDPATQSPEEYGHSNQGLVYYGLEAKVVKSNDRLNLVKIDKGRQEGVEVGSFFDIFKVNQDGTLGIPIARGKITDVRLTESVLTIQEYFKEVWIEEGFTAKKVIQ